MGPRPLTWLGGGVVAAILAATVLATVVVIANERDDARETRQEVSEPAVRRLAADVAAATASVEDLRTVVESAGRLSVGAFRRFTSAPLDRQPALGSLAFTPVPGSTDDPPLVSRRVPADPSQPDRRKKAARKPGRPVD